MRTRETIKIILFQKNIRVVFLSNSPRAVMLYDGKGSCPKPGLIFLRTKMHYYVLIRISESGVHVQRYFSDKNWMCFHPLHTRTLKNILEGACANFAGSILFPVGLKGLRMTILQYRYAIKL